MGAGTGSPGGDGGGGYLVVNGYYTTVGYGGSGGGSGGTVGAGRALLGATAAVSTAGTVAHRAVEAGAAVPTGQRWLRRRIGGSARTARSLSLTRKSRCLNLPPLPCSASVP